MVEALIGADFALLQRGELVLRAPWSNLWFSAALLIGASVIVWFLWRNPGLNARRRWLIGSLQIVMLALALFVLSQPALRIEALQPGENTVAVLLDGSASMAYGEEGVSRLEQAKSGAATVIAGLAEEYQIARYVFAERASSAEAFDAVDAAGNTRLARSLEQVLELARTSPLAAVVAITDGGENGGRLPPASLDAIRQARVPVHVVGIGRERMPEDFELEQVRVPAQVLPQTTVAAQAVIRHDAPGTVRLKAYDGRRLLAVEEITLNESATRTTASIDFRLPAGGHRELNFEIDGGAAETHRDNNRRAATTESIEEPNRILYLEGEPRWEYKFLRRALADEPGVELVSVLRVSPNTFYRQGVQSAEELANGFPASREALFAYQGLVIGSIEAARFSEDEQAMIRDFVAERGGGLLMLAGPNGLGAGGWGNSLLADALPARLGKDDGALRREPVPVALTPRGRRAPMLSLDPSRDDSERRWRELPEIADFQAIGPLRPGAVTLLEANTGSRALPLLVTQSYGRGQSYLLATGGTWRWQMGLPVEDQRHETFWRQLARALTINAPKPFEVSVEQAGASARVRVVARNGAFEAETATPIVTVSSTDQSDQTLPLQPALDEPGVWEGEFEPGLGGTHYLEARLGTEQRARTAFHFDAGGEAFGLRQQRGLLESLAQATGGRYWSLDALSDLPNAIESSSAGIVEERFYPLWNAPILFLLLLGLKAGEWLLRRRWRTI